MQISIYVINNMPEPGRNLAADACMGRTQLSPCIYNFSTRTIRASRNAMPAWYFFHAEPLISRFSLEKYITLLQQLWQTVLMWNLYPIFISLNQLAVKITPAESFLWMHLHQFQYLYKHMIKDKKPQHNFCHYSIFLFCEILKIFIFYCTVFSLVASDISSFDKSWHMRISNLLDIVNNLV